jgi:MerR family copper efflux transcriptional regulator
VRIGQLAARTAIPVRTIRFYEHAGLLPAPHRTPGGYRAYNEDAVTRLRFVRSAQALGLSLAEIGEVLRIRDHEGPPCSYVTELLNTHIRALETRIGELTSLRDELCARLPPDTRTRPAADPTRSATSSRKTGPTTTYHGRDPTPHPASAPRCRPVRAGTATAFGYGTSRRG